jgi:hypothetical protein
MQTKESAIDAGCRIAGGKRIYEEHGSGKDAARLELLSYLKELRAVDVVVVWRLDRLGRSLSDLVRIAGQLEHRKVGLESITEKIETVSSAGKLRLRTDLEQHLWSECSRLLFRASIWRLGTDKNERGLLVRVRRNLRGTASFRIARKVVPVSSPPAITLQREQLERAAPEHSQLSRCLRIQGSRSQRGTMADDTSRRTNP